MTRTLKSLALGLLTIQTLATLVVSGGFAMAAMILLSTLGDLWGACLREPGRRTE